MYIHTSERMNFSNNFDSDPATYLLVAESIGDLAKKTSPEYHAAAWALILYEVRALAYPNYLEKSCCHQMILNA